MSDRVKLDIEGPVAIVRLNRPDKHNGMDVAMIQALIATAKQLKKNRDIRAVILAGEGPSFCAGIDVKSMFGGGAMSTALAFLPLLKPVANKYQNVCLVWRTLSVPVIAAIHGNCFGAGIQLALGADIRFATPDAKLAVMEAKWGLIPDMAGMLLLREVLPRDVAFELTTTGRILMADEAKALGLITRIEADPLAAAKAFAAQIATRSPDASAAAKCLFREVWSASEHRVLAGERRWQLRMLLGRNQRIASRRNMGKPDAAYLPRSW
ncbi:MAG: crotonase/enoyl-CoA hydratase family protein [Stagnimonas sp.]|nr:crotonase/enoyl-CoA hydratase family protein [Stagnimonas sp.]